MKTNIRIVKVYVDKEKSGAFNKFLENSSALLVEQLTTSRQSVNEMSTTHSDVIVEIYSYIAKLLSDKLDFVVNTNELSEVDYKFMLGYSCLEIAVRYNPKTESPNSKFSHFKLLVYPSTSVGHVEYLQAYPASIKPCISGPFYELSLLQKLARRF